MRINSYSCSIQPPRVLEQYTLRHRCNTAERTPEELPGHITTIERFTGPLSVPIANRLAGRGDLSKKSPLASTELGTHFDVMHVST